MTKSRAWLWILGIVGLCYIAAAAYMYAVQDERLYPAKQTSLSEALDRAEKLDLSPWPKGAEEPKGFISQPSRKPRGTVLVFHGNKGTALGRSHYVEAFERHRLRVLLVEYPGYGHRPGTWGERTFTPDAVAIFDRARKDLEGPVYVVGESLGAGVAGTLIRERADKIAGVALVTPWDSFAEIAQRNYPWLPAKLLVKSKYDTVANLAQYPGPTAIAIALEDEIVPVDHSRRLYDSLAKPKKLWEFEDATHNTWPHSPDAKWWGQVVEFWRASD